MIFIHTALTFLAKVTRNIGKHGFLINLPNKKTGFLSTRKKYALGENDNS